ncbi:peptidoglycan-binding protein [Escherichia coli]|nr:peptidoglycan-binding protein [Escherichia coli]EHS3383854.1 peptidoglycan-binding protein [Escherichia coli]EHS3583932.1 peptidoglycan-binding protein [Escherichia coli]EHS3811217.1 peptidoglycan-binding protein [Escherichia coli]EHS3878128.1 peptidoglycan-binding protein [Escherichia coli]
MNFILRPDIEGGYVNDPTDSGGETKYGISDRRDGVIDGKTDVNGDGKPDTRIRDLTREQVAQIYWRDYWLPAGCDQWPDGVAMFVFDAAVQHGVKKAIRILQEAADVDADGIIGSRTRKAVSLSTPDWLLARCIVRRSRFYADIIKSKPAQGKYLNGWFNRMEKLTDACLEIIDTPLGIMSATRG